MKKISITKTALVTLLVLVTGFSSYALANMGFGSRMDGYGGNGFHMSGSNGYNGNHMGNNRGYGMSNGQYMYNGNHMRGSGYMGYGMNNDHMFSNRYGPNSNQMHNDMKRWNNKNRQNYSNDKAESRKDIIR